MSLIPPLPEPAIPPSTMIESPREGSLFGSLYTTTQIREYGQQCRKQALEEAIKGCDDLQIYGEVGALLCRDSIRELLK